MRVIFFSGIPTQQPSSPKMGDDDDDVFTGKEYEDIRDAMYEKDFEKRCRLFALLIREKCGTKENSSKFKRTVDAIDKCSGDQSVIYMEAAALVEKAKKELPLPPPGVLELRKDDHGGYGVWAARDVPPGVPVSLYDMHSVGVKRPDGQIEAVCPVKDRDAVVAYGATYMMEMEWKKHPRFACINALRALDCGEVNPPAQMINDATNTTMLFEGMPEDKDHMTDREMMKISERYYRGIVTKGTQPNAKYMILGPVVVVVSTSFIPKGTEITVSYGANYFINMMLEKSRVTDVPINERLVKSSESLRRPVVEWLMRKDVRDALAEDIDEEKYAMLCKTKKWWE